MRLGQKSKRFEPDLRRTYPFALLFVDCVFVEGKNATLWPRVLFADTSLYRSAPKSINALSSGESESMLLLPRNYSWVISVRGNSVVSVRDPHLDEVGVATATNGHKYLK